MNLDSTHNRYLQFNGENREKIEDCIIATGRCSNQMIVTSKQPIENPGSMDVLCGRGRGYFEHSGNRRMLSIIARFKSEYQTASKVEKSAIAQRVLEIVLTPQDGVRPKFLKRDPTSSGRKSPSPDSGGWYELCEREVYKKVAHTLREQKSIIKLSKETTKIRESIMHQLDTHIIRSDDEDECPNEQYDQTSKTSEQPIPPFVRLVCRDSFVMSEPSRSGLVDFDLEAFDDLFLEGCAEDATFASSHYQKQCRNHMLPRGEQQPLNFLQEPVFNEKEVDTLLHAVLGEEAADDFILDSFLEDLILHNSFRASFSKPTTVV